LQQPKSVKHCDSVRWYLHATTPDLWLPTCLAGHQAKLARSFLAATYSNDVVTIGDLDHYIFQVRE
jgi:hypothetical protein